MQFPQRCRLLTVLAPARPTGMGNVGIVPQNVNFAVKSDYLGALLIAAGIKNSAVPVGLAGDDLIQAVKEFCVSVQNWR